MQMSISEHFPDSHLESFQTLLSVGVGFRGSLQHSKLTKHFSNLGHIKGATNSQISFQVQLAKTFESNSTHFLILTE